MSRIYGGSAWLQSSEKWGEERKVESQALQRTLDFTLTEELSEWVCRRCCRDAAGSRRLTVWAGTYHLWSTQRVWLQELDSGSLRHWAKSPVVILTAQWCLIEKISSSYTRMNKGTEKFLLLHVLRLFAIYKISFIHKMRWGGLDSWISSQCTLLLQKTQVLSPSTYIRNS